ncbi:MAG: hypothetical protein D4R56_05955 [Deltaproteobacteria bacterium]|nr:MAG: hypothetical protein D4R56_05955 [Deltaproteobacteria bacterium]
MLEKLLGAVIIIVAFVVLWLISAFQPPIFVQIICAFAGAIVCLIGIVIVFSEGPVFFTAARRVKTSPQVGETAKGTVQ